MTESYLILSFPSLFLAPKIFSLRDTGAFSSLFLQRKEREFFSPFSFLVAGRDRRMHKAPVSFFSL